MRRLVAGVVLALVLLVIVLAVVRLPGGPIEEGGNAVGGPMQAGRPFTAGVFFLSNSWGRRVVVDEVDLHGRSGLTLLGVAVRRVREGGIVALAPGYPPAWAGAVRPVEGVEVGPNESLPLVVGLRGPPGAHVLRGLDVEYTVPLVGGRGLRFRRHVKTELSVCLHPGREISKRCKSAGL